MPQGFRRSLRRQVKQLVALAEKLEAQVESVRSSNRFRPLTETEAAAVVGGDLLASLTDVLR